MPAQEAAQIVLAILSALGAFHKRGIIHRDLKPANIVLTTEAIATLRQREQITWRLGRLYLTSLRALLENNRQESLEACDELRKATFRDPEGIYYLARELSYLGEQERALETLFRAIENGFFCYSAMARDPWLDSIRARPEFTALLRKAHQLHREALTAFVAARGDSLLGVSAEAN